MFKGKAVLVTGSMGMIGRELVIQLEELGADVYGADLFRLDDLRDFGGCKYLCKAIDYVFHLAGIKGSPKMTKEKPVDFMGPMLQFDTNMILAAQRAGVKKFLYTSSIAVEHPEEDKYPAWAKQTAETLIEAMKIQYPTGTEYCVVRPANVYGRFDKQDTKHPMVITSLVKKALKEKELSVWGDGTQVRDFINAKDVARGMIQAMREMPDKPVNLCSGKEVTIKQIADIISKETGKPIVYDPTKPRGSDRRVMDLNWDFKPEISLEEGLKEVICQFSS